MVLCSAPWYSNTRFKSGDFVQKYIYSRKMTIRMPPSVKFRQKVEAPTSVIQPATSVGSSTKRPTESTTPSKTARSMKNFSAFSEPSFFSIQASNLFGSSCSSSGSMLAE